MCPFRAPCCLLWASLLTILSCKTVADLLLRRTDALPCRFFGWLLSEVVRSILTDYLPFLLFSSVACSGCTTLRKLVQKLAWSFESWLDTGSLCLSVTVKDGLVWAQEECGK